MHGDEVQPLSKHCNGKGDQHRADKYGQAKKSSSVCFGCAALAAGGGGGDGGLALVALLDACREDTLWDADLEGPAAVSGPKSLKNAC
jgi:hypothetical protein